MTPDGADADSDDDEVPSDNGQAAAGEADGDSDDDEVPSDNGPAAAGEADGDSDDDEVPTDRAPWSVEKADENANEGGFAILGDSDSDEYRADDNRGGDYASVTLNWMEQLVVARGLDFGKWGTWGGPRRTGFEYNWARSGARAADLVGQGQAAGVAQQIENGAVKYVYVHIGANDFHLRNGTYDEIYDGTLTDSEVAVKVAKVVRDITSAVDIVLAANPERIVVTLKGDPDLSLRVRAKYPDVAGRNRASKAIALVNEGLTRMAATRSQVTVYDLNEFAASLLDRVDATGNIEVGDELISLMEPGDEPHHAQLGDRSGHLGTVVSGLFANATFIGPFNQAEQLGIPMLTDAEILSHAGM